MPNNFIQFESGYTLPRLWSSQTYGYLDNKVQKNWMGDYKPASYLFFKLFQFYRHCFRFWDFHYEGAVLYGLSSTAHIYSVTTGFVRNKSGIYNISWLLFFLCHKKFFLGWHDKPLGVTWSTSRKCSVLTSRGISRLVQRSTLTL